MTVSVLVPFNPGDHWRDRAWRKVRAHYVEHHPSWQIVTGTCDGSWSKAKAVHAALSHADGDTLVVADADCHVAPQALTEAVEALAGHGWSVPHHMVKRLTKACTLTGGTHLERPEYRGVAGGGITVLTRAAYESCPMDPRFIGWGGEDVAWGWALRTVHGIPWRGTADLWHLYHPTARVGQIGSDDSRALVQRWRFATHRPGPVLDALINEAREALWSQ